MFSLYWQIIDIIYHKKCFYFYFIRVDRLLVKMCIVYTPFMFVNGKSLYHAPEYESCS